MNETESIPHFALFYVRVESLTKSANQSSVIVKAFANEDSLIGKRGSIFFEVPQSFLAPKINQQLLVTISPITTDTESGWHSLKENPDPDAAEDC